MTPELQTTRLQLPDKSKPSLHDMGADNEFEWRAGGKIAALRVHRNTVDAINRWMDIQLALFANAEEGETLRLLFDMRNVGLTNYARKRSREIIMAYPEVERRVAVVLPIGAMAYVMRLHILVELFSLVPRKRQVFTDPDAAIAWLLLE